MAKKYIFVRMPTETFQRFQNKKVKMEKDIKFLTGKELKLSMPKLFDLVGTFPVEIDYTTLVKTAKNKRGKY